MGLHSSRTRWFTLSRNARVSRVTPGYTQSRNAWILVTPGITAERVGFHSRGIAWGYTVAERVGLHSRGTRGFTQSRNAWIYSRGTPGFTVEERLGLQSGERVDLHSRNGGTRNSPAVYTVAERLGLQSRNAWAYSRGTRGFTVAERVGLHSRGTRGFTQSIVDLHRNAWGYTVAERLGLQSRNAWVYTV